MKRFISISLCLLILSISALAFANKSQIGSFERIDNSKNYSMKTEPQALLVVVAFVIGFYNGYMDTKTDYGKDKEVLALNIGYDKKDFSSFDN